MTASIKIIYRSAVSGSLILQQASFPLKGRKPHKVTFNWWQQIKREMEVKELHQAICNGEEITNILKEMDRKSNGADDLQW
jgi:hypothetical protein